MHHMLDKCLNSSLYLETFHWLKVSPQRTDACICHRLSWHCWVFTYERSWCLGDSRGVVIRGLRVNLWVTVRTVFRLCLCTDNSWRRQCVTLIQSTLQMSSVWGADGSNDVIPERLHSSKLKVQWFTWHFCVFCYQTGQFHPDCLDISWVFTPVSSSRYKCVLLLFDL